MRRFLYGLMAMLMISGCGTFGGAQPETVNQSFLLAYALVDGANNSIADAIVFGTLTDRDQAQDLRNTINEVKISLDTAFTAFQAGQQFNEGVFDNTRVTLQVVRTALLALGTDQGSLTPEHQIDRLREVT